MIPRYIHQIIKLKFLQNVLKGIQNKNYATLFSSWMPFRYNFFYQTFRSARLPIFVTMLYAHLQLILGDSTLFGVYVSGMSSANWIFSNLTKEIAAVSALCWLSQFHT